MSRLSRISQLIFGSSAGVDQLGVIGSLAAGSPTFTTDPSDAPGGMQSLSNYLTGLYSVVIGNNSPAIEDINSLFYVITYQLAYLCQVGIAEFNANDTYYIGDIASDGAGNFYYSIVDSNFDNALTNNTKWLKLGGIPVVETKSADYTILTQDSLIRMSGTHTATLPDATVVPGYEYIVKNVDSSGNTVTVGTTGGQTIDGASTYSLPERYQFVRIKSNGTNYDIVGW